MADMEIDSSDDELLSTWVNAANSMQPKEEAKRKNMERILKERLEEADMSSDSSESELDFSYQDKPEPSDEEDISDSYEPQTVPPPKKVDELVTPSQLKYFWKEPKMKDQEGISLQVEDKRIPVRRTKQRLKGTSSPVKESKQVQKDIRLPEDHTVRKGKDAGSPMEETSLETEYDSPETEDSTQYVRTRDADRRHKYYSPEKEEISLDPEESTFVSDSSQSDLIYIQPDDIVLLIEK